MLVNRRNLQNKSEDLRQLRFSGKLFISESTCHENHQLSYKCHQLKNAGKIHSTWFWNNAVNVKLSERSNPVKIFHIIDIEKLLGILTIQTILLTTLHVKCSHLLLCCVFDYMFSLYSSHFGAIALSYHPRFLLMILVQNFMLIKNHIETWV